jgi:hypothetical protein
MKYYVDENVTCIGDVYREKVVLAVVAGVTRW